MADGLRYSLGIDLGSTPWSMATAEPDAEGVRVDAAAVVAPSGTDDAVVASVRDAVLAVTARRGAAPAVLVLVPSAAGGSAPADLGLALARVLGFALDRIRIVERAAAVAIGLEQQRHRGERDDPGIGSVAAVGAAIMGLDEEPVRRAGVALAGAGGVAAGGVGAALLAGATDGPGATGVASGSGAVGAPGVPMSTGGIGATGAPLNAAGVGAAGVPMTAAGTSAVGVPMADAGLAAVGVPLAHGAGIAVTGSPFDPSSTNRLVRRRAAIGATVVVTAVVAIAAVAVSRSNPKDSPSIIAAVSSTTTPPPNPTPTTTTPTTSPTAATAASTIEPDTSAPPTTIAPDPAVTAAAPTTIRPATTSAAGGSSGAACSVGAWIVDNASVARAFAGAAAADGGQIEVTGVTGAVRVTIGAHGESVTTFDNWSLSASLPGGAGIAVVSKAGSETATLAFADDGTVTITGVAINSTTKVSIGGSVFREGPSLDAMVQNGRTFTCSGNRLDVRVVGEVDYVVAMTRSA